MQRITSAMKTNLISLLIIVGLCCNGTVHTTKRPDKSSSIRKNSSWDCKTDFAALLFLIKDSQELVHAWKNPTQQPEEGTYFFDIRKERLTQGATDREQRIALLNKQFEAHFVRCSARYQPVDIYKKNIQFAENQSGKHIKKALDWVKKGEATIGGFALEKAEKWSAVAEALHKKSSEV